MTENPRPVRDDIARIANDWTSENEDGYRIADALAAAGLVVETPPSPDAARDRIAMMAWLHWLSEDNYDNAALDAPAKPDATSYRFADALIAQFPGLVGESPTPPRLYGETIDADMVDRVVDNENTAVMRELIYALWAAVESPTPPPAPRGMTAEKLRQAAGCIEFATATVSDALGAPLTPNPFAAEMRAWADDLGAAGSSEDPTEGTR